MHICWTAVWRNICIISYFYGFLFCFPWIVLVQLIEHWYMLYILLLTVLDHIFPFFISIFSYFFLYNKRKSNQLILHTRQTQIDRYIDICVCQHYVAMSSDFQDTSAQIRPLKHTLPALWYLLVLSLGGQVSQNLPTALLCTSITHTPTHTIAHWTVCSEFPATDKVIALQPPEAYGWPARWTPGT